MACLSHSRMKLRSVWSAPVHLRMVYKVNKVAAEKAEPVSHVVKAKPEEQEESVLALYLTPSHALKSNNRYAPLSDDEEAENPEPKCPVC